jgi:hypothetical protein
MASSIQLDKPGELIAAIPGLLRFTPADSAVITMFTGSTLRGTIRIDLAPLTDHETTATTVEQLRKFMTAQSISSAVTVVVGGTDDTSPDQTTHDSASGPQGDGVPALPQHAFVAEFQRITGSLGVGEHTVWVDRIEQGRTWRCYTDPHCTGTVPDPRTSPLAVARVAAGEITYASREDLAAQLTDPPADLDRRAVLLRQSPHVSTADAIALVHDTIRQISDTDATSPRSPMADDDTVVRLAHALTDHAVRDASMALVLTDSAAAERLWFALTRATPRPEATHPATLLAISAALRGDGVLANVALDTALAADPNNRMANLLGAVLAQGVSPDKLRHLLAESITDQRTDTPQSRSAGSAPPTTPMFGVSSC